MGSGLIWAGIGKGISDASQTFGSAMMKAADSEEADRREALREERLLKRQEALDQLKADREEAKAEALKTRVSSEAVEVEKRAAEAPIRRDATALGALGAQVAGESPVMSQEEREALIRENPQYREVYRKAGLIGEDKMDPRLRSAEDQATAALELGAHSSVIEAYSKKRTAVLEQIRIESAEKRADQRHQESMTAISERGRQFDVKTPILQQQADAATTRAGAAVTSANRPRGGAEGGDSGAEKIFKTITGADGREYGITRSGKKIDLGESSKFNKDVEDAISKLEKNNYDFGKLPESEKRSKAIERLTGAAGGVRKTGDNQPSTSGATKKNYSNLWK